MNERKYLIICNNLSIGGISKSLIALVKKLYYKNIIVDLFLLKKSDKNLLVEIKKYSNLVEIKELYQIYTFHKGLRKFFFFIKRKILLETILIHLFRKIKKNNDVKLRKKIMTFNQLIELKICKNSNLNVDLSKKYDCVISWSELLTNYILAENIICDHKIGWIHPDYITAGFNSKLDNEIFEKFDAVVSVSKASALSLKKEFPNLNEKIHYIYNLLDVEKIRQLAIIPPREFKQNKTFKIITVARIQNISKAFDRAIKIVSNLKNKNLKFVWYIVGDGEDKDSIQKAIINNNLDSYMVLLGKKNNPYPFIKNADLFVLQSYYEGKPIVIDEALVLGTPVLVSNYTSAEEQVKNGITGFIVNNEENAITDKLEEIIRNPKCLEILKKNLLNENFVNISNSIFFEQLLEKVINS